MDDGTLVGVLEECGHEIPEILADGGGRGMTIVFLILQS